MTPDAFRSHLRSESARFRDVLADCDPGARVPTCPDWSATELLWHLGPDVQGFWAHVIGTRPADPDDWDDPLLADAVAPDADDGARHAAALAAFDRAHADLVAALEAADPAEEAWSWAPDHTVGFTIRRQAHEALIHRVDAELTAGVDLAPIDLELGADGVAEVLGVMYGGSPSWGSFTATGQRVRFDLTDAEAGASPVWVALGVFAGTDPGSGTTYADEPDLAVVAETGGEPDAVVSGTTADLLLWLWHRADESGVAITGDADVEARLRQILGQPIN